MAAPSGERRTGRTRRLRDARQDEIAEGIAVGVYSLLAGMTPRDGGDTRGPRGKRIDLEKYSVSNEKSYFDKAAFPGR